MSENKGLITESKDMLDAYHVTGKDFPVPDSGKGVDNGPQGLVKMSDKQKSPRLNASDGIGPEVRGKEGKAFPTSTNGGESNSGASSVKPTFGVSVSCVDGTISPDVKKQRI